MGFLCPLSACATRQFSLVAPAGPCQVPPARSTLLQTKRKQKPANTASPKQPQRVRERCKPNLSTMPGKIVRWRRWSAISTAYLSRISGCAQRPPPKNQTNRALVEAEKGRKKKEKRKSPLQIFAGPRSPASQLMPNASGRTQPD